MVRIMNTTKYVIISMLLFFPLLIMGQEKMFEHKLVAGFNLGATAPIPLPQEVRAVKGWWPQFTPQLGYNIIYNHNEKWGIGSGITFDFKGMGARDKVKYMYTSVILEVDGDRPMEGYFSGKNETRIRASYLTIPLYVNYKPHADWSFRLGGYAAYRFSSDFKGEVWDGYLRRVDNKGDPFDETSEKINIVNKGDATFSFGGEMRDFDFGLLAGAERRINDKFGVTGNLNWGLTSIFPSNFKSISFNMYNIYVTLGLTYNL